MARFEEETQYRGYKLRLDVSETNVDTENKVNNAIIFAKKK